MDERNTNYRRQASGNRTTQRHRIDGRPAPRRQAARPVQPSNAGQARPAQRTARNPRPQTASSRSTRQASPQRQSQQRAHSAQNKPRTQAPRHSASNAARSARRAPVHESHSYQELNPRRGTNTYVRQGYSQKRSRLPLFAGGAAVLVVALFLITSLVGALTTPPQNNQDETPAADAAPQPSTLTVTFAGDCTLGTDVNFSADTSFNAKYEAVDDPSYFFANVADIFKNDDLTVVNMEGTLTTSTARQDKTFAFKGPADYAQILVKGNVETASLANNHSHDYGDQSYTDTISALESAGIGTFGYDRIDYRDVNGVKVALIGTYELAKHLDIQDELKQNIQTAKDNGAQLVAVFFHWGNEKETVPDDTQV